MGVHHSESKTILKDISLHAWKELFCGFIRSLLPLSSAIPHFFLYHCSSPSVCSLAFISWPTLSIKRHWGCCCTCSRRDNGVGVNSSDVWAAASDQKRRKEATSAQKWSSDTIYGKQRSSVEFLSSPGPRANVLHYRRVGRGESLPDNEVILVKVIPWKLVL